ncbi:hypothetical protein HPB47_001901, partial [Ixodes persulcatus]
LRLSVYADKHHQSFGPINIVHHVEMSERSLPVTQRLQGSRVSPGPLPSVKMAPALSKSQSFTFSAASEVNVDQIITALYAIVGEKALSHLQHQGVVHQKYELYRCQSLCVPRRFDVVERYVTVPNADVFVICDMGALIRWSSFSVQGHVKTASDRRACKDSWATVCRTETTLK